MCVDRGRQKGEDGRSIQSNGQYTRKVKWQVRVEVHGCSEGRQKRMLEIGRDDDPLWQPLKDATKRSTDHI